MSPDGSQKPPPEERLLRLIRGKAPRAQSPAGPPASRGGAGADPQASAAGVGMSARRGGRRAGKGFPPAAWAAKAAQVARSARWTDVAGAVFMAVLAAEAAGILIWVARPLPRVELPAPVPEASEGAQASTEPLFAATPSLAAAAPPTLFAASASAETPRGGGLSVTTKQLAARLMLVGVVAGNPAQAIIEDTQTQRTYMVSPGQAVTEGAVLEQVLDNRVVLDVGGEKIELAL